MDSDNSAVALIALAHRLVNTLFSLHQLKLMKLFVMTRYHASTSVCACVGRYVEGFKKTKQN